MLTMKGKADPIFLQTARPKRLIKSRIGKVPNRISIDERSELQIEESEPMT